MMGITDERLLLLTTLYSTRVAQIGMYTNRGNFKGDARSYIKELVPTLIAGTLCYEHTIASIKIDLDVLWMFGKFPKVVK